MFLYCKLNKNVASSGQLWTTEIRSAKHSGVKYDIQVADNTQWVT